MGWWWGGNGGSDDGGDGDGGVGIGRYRGDINSVISEQTVK